MVTHDSGEDDAVPSGGWRAAFPVVIVNALRHDFTSIGRPEEVLPVPRRDEKPVRRFARESLFQSPLPHVPEEQSRPVQNVGVAHLLEVTSAIGIAALNYDRHFDSIQHRKSLAAME